MAHYQATITIEGIIDQDHLDQIIDSLNSQAYVSSIQVSE